MKKQTEYKNEKIKRYGCYFCCMLDIAEKISKKCFTEDAVEKIYNLALKEKSWDKVKPAMTENCLLNDPEKITNLGLKELGCSKRIMQCGLEKNGIKDYWRGNSHDYEVIEMKTKWGSHFVEVDYNPDPKIETKGMLKKVFYKVV